MPEPQQRAREPLKIEIDVDSHGRGTVVLAGVDISSGVNKVTLRMRPGKPSTLELGLLPGWALEVEGKAVTTVHVRKAAEPRQASERDAQADTLGRV